MHHLSNILVIGYVALVAVIDSTRSRIPNVLTVSAATVGLILGTVMHGPQGLLAASEGLLVGFILFLPPYLLGGFGAGDVKALAAAGTFLGPGGALVATIFTLIIGGIAATFVLLRVGGRPALQSMFSRWAMRVYCYAPGSTGSTTGSTVSSAADSSDLARLRFPYGVAIACGVLAALL